MEENKNNQKSDELSASIDSDAEKQKMEETTTEINMREVSDIHGQEGFVPAPLGEMADTTISSADEEGENIFDEEEGDDIIDTSESNVSVEERQTLAVTAHDMPGADELLREAALDSTDEDGTPLNEGSFKMNITATDLDVPGAELDDANEKIGEEDEENNDYSIGSAGLGGDNTIIPEDEF
jgi:hypothetical protein